MGPVAGTHDSLRAVHIEVRRSQARQAPPAARPCQSQPADQGVQSQQANWQRAHARAGADAGPTVGVSKGTLPLLRLPYACPTATQGKGRLRPSGCVPLAGTPQQRPSVSAHRHPALTCCERCCWAWLASVPCCRPVCEKFFLASVAHAEGISLQRPPVPRLTTLTTYCATCKL